MVETMLAPVPNLPAGSPIWWVDRLARQLTARQPDMDVLQRYAAGQADDPMVDGVVSRAFRRIMGHSKTNLCGLVIEAVADRNAVSGFRFGDNPDADSDAWRIWQGSDFDAESELAIRAALVNGRAFLSVEPGGSPDDPPTLYAEDPRQVIVAYAPGKRRERLAALKTWVDEWTGQTRATLYLPDQIHRLMNTAPTQGTVARWETLEADGSGPNPLGVVPFFELRNRPSIDGSVMAEHEDVLADQDSANHTALNMAIVEEYGASRQKWATGLEIPRDINGNPVEPFETAVNRLFVNENPDGKFGAFDATDLGPYIARYEATVRHMAAVSRTPAAYMLGHIANLSAEALAAAEAGLVTKCMARRRGWNGPIEDMMRCAFRAVGDPRADVVDAETIWMSAEVKSDAQVADAAVKLVQAGIITAETAQEDYLRMGSTERERDRQRRTDNDALGGFAAMLGAQVGDLTAPPAAVPPANA